MYINGGMHMIQSDFAFSGLSVDNLTEAREFYVNKLELPLQADAMGLTLQLPGGATLFIYEKPNHEPATYTVLNFVVEDINETIEHLVEAHGIEMLIYENLPAPQDKLGVLRGKASGDGPDIAWFNDPAGNVLAIIEN